VQLDLNNLPATPALALSLFNKGALAEAERHARNAVRIAPVRPEPMPWRKLSIDCTVADDSSSDTIRPDAATSKADHITNYDLPSVVKTNL
jgi:hypothetical protein